MKALCIKALLPLLLLGGLAPMSQAAQVKDMETALKKAKEDGIVICLYGIGWDKYSEKRCKEIVNDKDIARALGRALTLNYPCFESPTAEQKDILGKVLGGATIPFPKTYPALMWLDQKGRPVLCIQGTELTRSSNRELAQLISEKLNCVRKQAELLKAADKASGLDRARLLGQAYTLVGVYPPNSATMAEMVKLDPKDEAGYQCYFGTKEYDASAAILKLPFAESQALVSEMLGSPSYSVIAKQSATIAMLGQWRKQGTREDLPKMREYAQQVIALDEQSYHAGSAQFMLDNWFLPFDLATGWFPQIIPKDATPIYLEGDIPIESAGTYEMTFQHTDGRSGLTIESVSLYDGDTLVCEDKHTGVTGTKNKNNTYLLTTKKRVKNPRIRIVLNQGEKNATKGMISIKRVKK